MLHAVLDTCQERPWVYVESVSWSERVNTPQAGAAHRRPGDPGRRQAKELTLLIRIHHKGRRTRREASAGGRGGSVCHVVLDGSGLHRLLHGARSGSDKALPKSTDTRRPRRVSQKRKDTDSAPTRFLRNWRQLQSRAPGSRLTTRNKCWQCCRRITCGRSGIREDTCGPAADAAGCRPSGGAVDSPPQAVTSRMCASGSQDFMREAWLRRL